MLEQRDYWFVKWFIAASLLLPFYGYMNLDARSDRSLVWNLAYQDVNVGILPNESIMTCLQHKADQWTVKPMGFEPTQAPVGCTMPLRVRFLTFAGASLFFLFTGLYFWATRNEEEEIDTISEQFPANFTPQRADKRLRQEPVPQNWEEVADAPDVEETPERELVDAENDGRGGY